MPIKIPDHLPAKHTLEQENIYLILDERAKQQDIRPLRILILNLMPKKVETETQLLRLLGNTSLQIHIELLKVSSHSSKNTSQDHLLQFYQTFDSIAHQYYDGLIVTGAPVETMPFEQVNYWQELTRIFHWSCTHVYSTLHICWGAQAGLYYHYGIDKEPLPQKMFGVFAHNITNPNHLLLRGFDEVFLVPHSRHTAVNEQAVRACPNLEILSYSKLAGLHMLSDKNSRLVFLFGHPEYDRLTLQQEYLRDKEKGKSQTLPFGYFPDDDPYQRPPFIWRGHANLLFKNWLNVVYQHTPFDLKKLPALHF